MVDNIRLIDTKEKGDTCLHCGVGLFVKKKKIFHKEIMIEFFRCTKCNKSNIDISVFTTAMAEIIVWSAEKAGNPPMAPVFQGRVYPSTRKENVKSFPFCPEGIYQDYREARIIQGDSIRGSAMLARRALERVLHDRGYQDGHLKQLIDKALAETDVDLAFPKRIRDMLHALNEVANFTAHIRTDVETNEVIEADFSEVDLTLSALESIIEFTYEDPEKSASWKESVNRKLVRAGKKPIS